MGEAKNLIKIDRPPRCRQTFFQTWYAEKGLKGQGQAVGPSDFDRMWLILVPTLAIPDIC